MARTETISFELGLFRADVLVTLFTEGELVRQETEKNRLLEEAAHEAERQKIKTEKEQTVGLVLEEQVFRQPVEVDKIKSIIAHGLSALYYDRTGKHDWQILDPQEDIGLLMKKCSELQSEVDSLNQQVLYLRGQVDAQTQQVKSPDPTVTTPDNVSDMSQTTETSSDDGNEEAANIKKMLEGER